MIFLIYDYVLNNELKTFKSPKTIPIPPVNSFNLSQHPTLSNLHVEF